MNWNIGDRNFVKLLYRSANGSKKTGDAVSQNFRYKEEIASDASTNAGKSKSFGSPSTISVGVRTENAKIVILSELNEADDSSRGNQVGIYINKEDACSLAAELISSSVN